MSDLLTRWNASIMPTYGTPKVTAMRGAGPLVWDADGRSYVDMLGGIAVSALGHGHPAIVDAVTEQLTTLGHVSNLAATEPPVALAERLLALTGRDGRVFFCNSGAEANEAALKLSRRTGRTHIVAAQGGFHGRTMGALSLTGQPSKSEPFTPLLPDVTHVPYGDVQALEEAVTKNTAMVILEPILGEAGVLPAPPGYLAKAREITTTRGALLALDEVQTGIGRTGAWFAHQHEGVQPDVITLAKGLGGGLPIGACVAFGDTATLLGPGHHGSTFGGNPVCCAAALAVIRTIEAEGLCEHAKHLGELLTNAITDLNHPLVKGVRGKGLLLGIMLDKPIAPALEASLKDAGYLTNAVAQDVLRLAPPLVLTDEQATSFVHSLPSALDTANEERKA